jgi:hypothetical protein
MKARLLIAVEGDGAVGAKARVGGVLDIVVFLFKIQKNRKGSVWQEVF